MRGYKPVQRLTADRESGQVAIEAVPETQTTKCQRAEGGIRTAIALVLVKQLNRSGELLRGHARVLGRDFLVRPILHPVHGYRTRILHRIAAKTALSVKYQTRAH